MNFAITLEKGKVKKEVIRVKRKRKRKSDKKEGEKMPQEEEDDEKNIADRKKK